MKPNNEAWTGVEIVKRSVPRLPKISTKQLIGVVHGGGQLAPNFHNRISVRQASDLQIIKSYSGVNKKANRNGDGFCYYSHKKPMKRNVKI